jgi:putative membrane protein
MIGTLMGLAVAFRCANARDRFVDGSTQWALLTKTSQQLAQLIWVHADERHSKGPVLGKRDLLAKINCLNLISAFAVALKHKLHFEPNLHYADLEPYIGHLSTFAKTFGVEESSTKRNRLNAAGQLLGVPMAISNPRKPANGPLGNLPLEILCRLQRYTKDVSENGTLDNTPWMMALKQIEDLDLIMTNCDRILSTPIPIAFCIAIEHASWLFLILLPFHLVGPLGWLTIPACLVVAYILIGFLSISRRIEHPFSKDMYCLPLDTFCSEIRHDIEILTASPSTFYLDEARHDDNKPLYPMSELPQRAWEKKSVEEIRKALAGMPELRSRKEHEEDNCITTARDTLP